MPQLTQPPDPLRCSAHGIVHLKAKVNGHVWCDAQTCQGRTDSIRFLPHHECATLFEFLDWLMRCYSAPGGLIPAEGGRKMTHCGFLSLAQHRIWTINTLGALRPEDEVKLLRGDRLRRQAAFFGLTPEALLVNFMDQGFQQALLTHTGGMTRGT